jgi:hypothetical protein
VALALYCDPVYFVVQSISVSRMTGLPKALAEINAIPGQVARGTEFSGYDPASIALSGVLALFCRDDTIVLGEEFAVRLLDVRCYLGGDCCGLGNFGIETIARDAFILASLRDDPPHSRAVSTHHNSASRIVTTGF